MHKNLYKLWQMIRIFHGQNAQIDTSTDFLSDI